MIRKNTLGLAATLAVALLAPAMASAQAGQPSSISAAAAGHESRTASPYHMSWTRDGLTFAAAGIGLGVSNLIASEVAPLTESELAGLTRDQVFWFDRSATRRYSTDLIARSEDFALPLAVAPAALLLDARMRGDWVTLAAMYVQINVLGEAASSIAKEAIPRNRPYLYNTDLSYGERTDREPGKAFFSSAATFAFARAVFLGVVYSDYHPESALRPYVWGVALTTAGAASYLRYASGIHYPSDVVVGAAVGAAIGYLVPRLHRTEESPLSVAPSTAGGGAGLTIQFTF
jgi:membrane-associated phospholipid phosphatase